MIEERVGVVTFSAHNPLANSLLVWKLLCSFQHVHSSFARYIEKPKEDTDLYRDIVYGQTFGLKLRSLT